MTTCHFSQVYNVIPKHKHSRLLLTVMLLLLGYYYYPRGQCREPNDDNEDDDLIKRPHKAA